MLHRGTWNATSLLTALFAFAAGVTLAAEEKPAASSAQLEFFEKHIRPLFVENCYNCHSADHKEAGGLRVDDYKSLVTGGKSGPAVVPGNSSKSVLFAKVTHDVAARRMPPDHPLSDRQIAHLKAWIDDGAAWPPLTIPPGLDQSLESEAEHYQYLKSTHWSWQPLTRPEVPALDGDDALASWPRSDVDRFILAGLQKKSIVPAGDASPRLLIRRLTYDLTGLPPSEQEIESFLKDESPTAVETVVDRLLSNPAFGERWGRHWLDVARYGESTGSARNLPYPHAWRYRDYVIDAFNADKPYDQFIREQIAGDLLPADSPQQRQSQLTATGFLALGVKDVNQRFKVRYDMDNVDEQIDTVSRAILGLTVSCARCHDHKFDPISSRDYYALAGIFSSTELCDALRNQMGGSGMVYYVPARLLPLYDEEANPEAEAARQAEIARKKVELAAASDKVTDIRDRMRQSDSQEDLARELRTARDAEIRLQGELVALNDPASRGPVAMGVREAGAIGDTELRIRGEAEKRGPTIPRGFLTVFNHVEAPSIGADRSGRYELALWLTDPANALTARVIVNRVWQHLFGEGLVQSVDNFGVMGSDPTHPELLDHLAGKFVANGWSIKQLIRELVLTRTYQLSSESSPAAVAVDPANRLLWRHSPRRLDAEEIRDAMLSISGALDRNRPAVSPSGELPVREVRNNGPEAAKILAAASRSSHRSVYLPLLRGLAPDSLEVFDFAEQGMVTGKRNTTTVAPQALYLLNDALVRRNSSRLAEHLLKSHGSDIEAAVKAGYRQVLNRSATPSEVSRAAAFVNDYRRASAGQVTVAKVPLESSGQGKAENATQEKAGESTTNVQNVQADGAGSREAALRVDEFLDAGGARTPDQQAVAAFVQALLGSAEFRYVR